MALPGTLQQDDLTFTVPEVRIWTVVVVDFDAAEGLATPVSAKEKSDTYIQDWWVIGPFANDLEMTRSSGSIRRKRRSI